MTLIVQVNFVVLHVINMGIQVVLFGDRGKIHKQNMYAVNVFEYGGLSA
jgi:hypothetical protein